MLFKVSAITIPLQVFDYYGEGDSCGWFEEASIETRISDILAAINFLRKATNVKKI